MILIDKMRLISRIITISCSAPNGASIIQVIPAPTFLTIFVEQIPGATEWEIFYRSLETPGRIGILRFPLTFISNSIENYYVTM